MLLEKLSPRMRMFLALIGISICIIAAAWLREEPEFLVIGAVMLIASMLGAWFRNRGKDKEIEKF